MGQEEKGAYEKKMEARLREQRDRAAEQLDSYRKAAGSALGEVQHGLETAVEAFADGVKRASDRFEKE